MKFLTKKRKEKMFNKCKLALMLQLKVDHIAHPGKETEEE